MLVALLASLLTLEPPLPAVDPDRLGAVLRELPPSRAAMGGPESVAGLDRTEALIVERLTASGLEARVEQVRWALPARRWGTGDDAGKGKGGRDAGGELPAHATPPRAWHNLIVDLPGTDLASEMLLVGAHYDAAPGAPGADDNGTGVAALLEVARVLKDRPHRRSIRLAFFTLEEVGLIGSMEHARSYRNGGAGQAREPGEPETAPSVRLIGMISLEMLGFYSDAPGSQRSPIKAIEGVFTPPTVGDFLGAVTISTHSTFCRRVASEMEKGSPGLKVLPFDVLPVPVPDLLRSDHAPFLAMGVPSVMLTDTANFRNPNYHRASDTIDTIDMARYTAAVRGLAAAIDAIAEPASAK